MRYFDRNGQLRIGHHKGLYFTQLKEGYKAWACRELEGFQNELEKLEGGSFAVDVKKLAKEEERRALSAALGRNIKPAGLPKPGRKKFTSRAVRPKNW